MLSSSATAGPHLVTSTPLSSRKRAVPARISTPSRSARTPLPGSAVNSSGSGISPSTRARSTIARATGCSDLFSAMPARSRIMPSPASPTGTTSDTDNMPVVRVPVLSSTTAVVRYAASSASPLRKSTPRSAPRPVPTITAVGVARPMAHGQAITSTATALSRAAARLPVAIIQPANVRTAIPRTAGTNTAAIRSAKRWMGGLPA